MNVDIHCHSAEKPFHSGLGKQTRDIFESFDFTIESNVLRALKKLLEKLSNVRLATQSNLDKLFLGDVRVAFVSFTPMERGFTVIDSTNKNIVKKVLQTILSDTNFNRKYHLSNKAINALTGYKSSDVEKVKVEMTHYYQEYLKKEYDFLLSFDGKKRTVNGKTYSVHFPKNYKELAKNVEDKAKVNIILNVEGAHVFGKMPGRSDILKWQKDTTINPAFDGLFVNDMTKFIREVKKFKVPIFSVGVAHHCWNQLVGHSRSLAGLIGGLVNQEIGINTGIHANGEVVLKELAKDDHFGKKMYPMIIDIKHLSCQARKDFYALRKKNRDLKKRSFFCSHTGICMSLRTMDEWIKYIEKDPKEKLERSATNGKYYLHEKSINTCREDLIELYNADGIVGLQLDEKRIMGELAIEELKKRSPDECKYVYAKCLWANIFCAVDELFDEGVKDNKKIWNLFAIGSDFDGLINHLDTFEDASKMNSLRATMLYYLEEPEDIILYKDSTRTIKITMADQAALKFGLSNQEIIDKLFSENAMGFLEKNF